MTKVRLQAEYDTETKQIEMYVEPQGYAANRGAMYELLGLLHEMIVTRGVISAIRRFEKKKPDIVVADADALRELRRNDG